MEVVDLALNGLDGYSVVEDLAGDPRFDGWILCDSMGWDLPNCTAQPYVDYYYASYDNVWGLLASADKRYNVIIKAALQNQFILFSPNFRLFETLFFGIRRPAEIDYFRMDHDRHRSIRYHAMLAKDLEERRNLRLKELREWPEIFDENTEKNIRRISITRLRRFNDLMEKKAAS